LIQGISIPPGEPFGVEGVSGRWSCSRAH
jgi:hypothetical protein